TTAVRRPPTACLSVSQLAADGHSGSPGRQRRNGGAAMPAACANVAPASGNSGSAHARFRSLRRFMIFLSAIGKGAQFNHTHGPTSPALMLMPTIRLLIAALAFAVASGAAPPALAQNWPAKPVKLIAVFPAGGSVGQ